MPFDIDTEVEPGSTILDAIRKANLPLKTTCGDCVVQILSGLYNCQSSAALSQQLISERYALACLTKINDNLTIQLPQFQQLSIKSVADSKFFEDHKNTISGIYEIGALIKKIDLHLPHPTLDDNYSDFKRLQREIQKNLSINDLICEYSVLKRLAHTIRKKKGQIAAILCKTGPGWTIIDIATEKNEE